MGSLWTSAPTSPWSSAGGIDPVISRMIPGRPSRWIRRRVMSARFPEVSARTARNVEAPASPGPPSLEREVNSVEIGSSPSPGDAMRSGGWVSQWTTDRNPRADRPWSAATTLRPNEPASTTGWEWNASARLRRRAFFGASTVGDWRWISRSACRNRRAGPLRRWEGPEIGQFRIDTGPVRSGAEMGIGPGIPTEPPESRRRRRPHARDPTAASSGHRPRYPPIEPAKQLEVEAPVTAPSSAHHRVSHHSRGPSLWRQTLPFTYGPTALLSVLRSMGHPLRPGPRANRISLRRGARAVARPGAHPLGLALVAERRGLNPHLVWKGPRPWSWSHIRRKHSLLPKRDYLRIESGWWAKCRRNGILGSFGNLHPCEGTGPLLGAVSDPRDPDRSDSHGVRLWPGTQRIYVRNPLRKAPKISNESPEEAGSRSGFGWTPCGIAISIPPAASEGDEPSTEAGTRPRSQRTTPRRRRTAGDRLPANP